MYRIVQKWNDPWRMYLFIVQKQVNFGLFKLWIDFWGEQYTSLGEAKQKIKDMEEDSLRTKRIVHYV